MRSPTSKSIIEIREELRSATNAASIDGHPFRWTVFGHFASRVQELAEDHERLCRLQETSGTALT